MSTRGILGGAVALVVVVSTSAFSVRAAGGLSRWTVTPLWSVPVPTVQMVADIPRRAGGPSHLVAQGAGMVVAVDAGGVVLAKRDLPGAAQSAATGDLDGDGVPDVIVAQGGTATTVAAFDGALKPLWSLPATTGLGQPARVLVVDLDGDRRREVVVGDVQGRLAALTSTGRVLWTFAFPTATENAEIRGLDDLSLEKGRGHLVAVARRSGELVLLDRAGRTVATLRANQPLRRLRVLDADGDGREEAVLGDEVGVYKAVGSDGRETPLGSIGETITEIRTVEADGDAAQREVLVGGKRGGFVLFSGRTLLVRGSVAGKVSAVGGVDADGDGREELFVGTEEGGLSMFSAQGELLAAISGLGKVERILAAKPKTGAPVVVVGAGSALSAFRAQRETAAVWYQPWSAGVLGLLAIAVGSAVLALTQRPPAPSAPVVDPRTQEVERAIARVNDLVARGIAPPDQGAARLQQLERQLARLREGKPASSRRKDPSVAPPPPPRRKG